MKRVFKKGDILYDPLINELFIVEKASIALTVKQVSPSYWVKYRNLKDKRHSVVKIGKL